MTTFNADSPVSYSPVTIKILYEGNFVPVWIGTPILDVRHMVGTSSYVVTRLGSSQPRLSCKILVANDSDYNTLRNMEGYAGTLTDFFGDDYECYLSIKTAQRLPGGEHICEVDFLRAR